MRHRLPLVPTERLAWIAAIAAPVALVIASAAPQIWLVAPIAGASLFMVALLDAYLAGKIGSWLVVAPEDAEVGEPTPIGIVAGRGTLAANATIEAVFEFDPRLGIGGRASASLQLDPGSGEFKGEVDSIPSRRGTAMISRAWLRWNGPLGLGARQVAKDCDHEVRIWPDLAPVRSRNCRPSYAMPNSA